jgi:drug/metabolite transporter (DMT)-like permease
MRHRVHGAAPAAASTADAAMLLVTLIWGINLPLMKLALRDIEPFTFTAVRLTLSALVLWGLYLCTTRTATTEPVDWRRRAALVALVTLAGSIGYQCLLILGVPRTPAGNTALIGASAPVWAALIAAALGLERCDRRMLQGIALGLLGTALIMAPAARMPAAGSTLVGDVLILTGTIAWSAAAVLSKPLLAGMSAIALAAWTTTLSLPVHYALGWSGMTPVLERTLPLPTFCLIAYSGALSTGVAYALWNSGIRALGPARATVYTNLVPVVAMVAGWFLLDEGIAPAQVAGGALIVLGILRVRGRAAAGRSEGGEQRG